MNDISIRLLRPGDESILGNVATDVFDDPIRPGLAAEFLSDPRHHMVVALSSGQVVGMASAVHYVHPDKPSELWVNEVGVAPAFQSRGIGKQLMAALLARGRSLGCAEAWLGTEPANTAARRLYAAVGGKEESMVYVTFALSGEPARQSSSPGPPDIVLRPAEAADVTSLVALATQVFLATYAPSGIRPAIAREVQAEFSAAVFSERLASPSTRVTVAERDGHLVAFSEVVLGAAHPLAADASSAELARLYVQSPFLRRGVGGRLLRHAEALASSAGASTLWLTAWVGNAPALAFYASQGYEPRGRTEHEFEGELFENRLFAKRLRAER